MLAAMLLTAWMLVAGGCEESGPEPSPGLPYPLADLTVEVENVAGEVTITPFAFPGMENNAFVPFVFIKESSPLSEYNCSLFANRQEDMGGRLQGLDVKYYCIENGILESLDSRDIRIPYKWVEVSSFLDADKEQKLVVRYDSNSDPVAREMYVHFHDGLSWGVVCIRQQKSATQEDCP